MLYYAGKKLGRCQIRTINVTKLASFVGLTAEQLWAYLDSNDSVEKINIERILMALDTMPSSDVLAIVNAGVQKLVQAS